MVEMQRQLISETRVMLPMVVGQDKRLDHEYRRLGTCNNFKALEPLTHTGRRRVTERCTKTDRAKFLARIAERYCEAKKIALVMDDLNTHRPGALYEAYTSDQAKALWDGYEFVYMPKHGSWLNIAEVQFSLMARQCLNRWIDSIEMMRQEISAW